MEERRVIVKRTTGTVKAGIGYGVALAMVISYVEYKSVLWAIIHGFFSWLYVIYYVLFTRPG